MESAFAAEWHAAAHVLIESDRPDRHFADPQVADPPPPAEELPDTLSIAGADGHHLVRVRRLQVGETVTAADGRGGWRPYRVSAVGDRVLELTATGPSRTEPVPTPRLGVAFALTKGVKPETVVRQLTELGVDEILPVIAARSIARPRAGRADVVSERLARVAREAAMQCRRARLPRIAPLGPLAALAGRPGLVIAERGGPGPTGLPEPGSSGWLVVVGPEGGWAPEDLQALDGPGPDGGAVRAVPRLAVGSHVLRAETAAVAAAAVLSARRS